MKTCLRGPVLDRFRLIAALLVVCIHTSPLDSISPLGDFVLTRIFCRVAVPFFLMISGHFLAAGQWRSLGRFWRKTLLLYGLAILLYLPLNWYTGSPSGWGWIKALLTDGTFYHLWYFPALLLGVLLARLLARLGMPAALTLAGVLYLIGLGGDSYYGLTAQVPALAQCYDGLFVLSSYTRNGLFFVPLFVLLGVVDMRLSRRTAVVGFLLSLAAMTAEGLLLHTLGTQRHDSMYLTLPFCILFLFSLLQSANQGRDLRARQLSLLIYLLHPWSIVAVRGEAELLHLESLLIHNSVGHFCAVVVVTLCAALVLDRLRPLRPSPTARAWREVDRNALIHNAQVLRQALPPGCSLMAVVKAEAYGHGGASTARILRRAGVGAFAVACLAEGIALRRHGVSGTILILGYTPPEEAPLLRRWRLTQTVADEAHGLALAAQGVPVRVHLALDTGMHRLGIPAEDHEAIARLYALPILRIGGVFSHLCVSDSPAPADIAFTQGQLDRFYAAVGWMKEQGYDPGAIHIQASYGLWNLPPQPCRYVRAGIALYGVSSDQNPVLHPLDLRPALSLRAKVASVRTIPAGQGAGYGLAFRAEQDTRLAVVTIGYADGLPRSLSQQGGRVIIRGVSCPMVGRMCMDQLLVDVTHLPQAVPGDMVTLIGTDGEAVLKAEEVAVQSGTIANELLSRLGSRLPVVRT
ncbi:serine racemase VanT catalytic subunit [Flavonifractor sp. AGMB03687]|uniref:serine racemase VanT catalytic subunit n=1 Tax=Flavonifractor sp. AGMB03687 TaxID=2785133 RepID=UPI001AE01BC6